MPSRRHSGVWVAPQFTHSRPEEIVPENQGGTLQYALKERLEHFYVFGLSRVICMNRIYFRMPASFGAAISECLTNETAFESGRVP